MNQLPLISVIVPIYNAENTLKKCISQLVKQTYENFEILLIDDGSNDSSSNICKEFASAHSNITLFTQTHLGSGKARNLGIEKASGKYLFFADADDTLELNALSCMVKAMESSNADLLVFGYRQNAKEINYSSATLPVSEIKRQYFCTKEQKVKGSVWNKCFKACIIKEKHLLFPEIARNEEEIFLMDYINTINTGTVTFIEEILYNFNPINMQTAFVRLPENYGDLVVEFKDECLKYSKKWNQADKKDLEAISREFYGKMLLALKLCLNPKKKNRQKFNIYADLLIKELPLESSSIKNIRIYKLLKKHLYFIVWLLLGRQI